MAERKYNEFSKYYQRKDVTGTYDNQRMKTAYRRKKRTKELAMFLELLNKKQGERVLEIGCSSGFLTEHLGEVTAIDTSKDMLDIAHSKNPKAKCLHGDLFKLPEPFSEEEFDSIVTMRVLTHLEEPELRKALRVINKTLKKNGSLVFDLEDRSALRRVVNKYYTKIFRIKGYPVYQYNLKEAREVLRDTGFELSETRYLKHKVGRQIMLKATKIQA